MAKASLAFERIALVCSKNRPSRLSDWKLLWQDWDLQRDNLCLFGQYLRDSVWIGYQRQVDKRAHLFPHWPLRGEDGVQGQGQRGRRCDRGNWGRNQVFVIDPSFVTFLAYINWLYFPMSGRRLLLYVARESEFQAPISRNFTAVAGLLFAETAWNIVA